MNTSSSLKNDLPGFDEIEAELKKRLGHPYIWGRKQNNDFDRKTNFIYHTFRFEEMIAEIEARFRGKPDYKAYHDYALNRWFNFWSANAIERIFCSVPGVVASRDEKDRLVDFTINGVTFDHKTSVYPRNFTRTIEEARKNTGEMIEWLYRNQSQQQRKHFRNRLFIVLYAEDLSHWKLKAEINWLKKIIEHYMIGFNPDYLMKFNFESGITTLSDVIWAIEGAENYKR